MSEGRMSIDPVFVKWIFERVSSLHQRQPISKSISTTPVDHHPEKGLRLRFTLTSEHANFVGYAHGGMIATMFDEAICLAATCMVGPARFKGTVEARTTYLRPVPLTEVEVVARAIHETPRLIFLEAELLGADGLACARASAIVSVAPPPRGDGLSSAQPAVAAV